jgi:hypothetical protein
MHDVGAHPPNQDEKLEQAEEVARGMHRAADVPEAHEAHARGAGRVAERAISVRGDDDLEAAGQGREQLRHVGLRPAGLCERDEDEDPRHPPSVPGAKRNGSPEAGR